MPTSESSHLAKPHGLCKRERLQRRDDFARVYGGRRIAADEVMAVYVAANGLKWTRLGISVSRKVGSAVRRSYVRRRIREAFRTNKDHLPRGIDLICVAKPAAAVKSMDVASSLIRLVNQAAGRLNLHHKR